MAHLKQKSRRAQTIMNETEFLRYSDQLFAHIEDQLDQCGADFDCEHNGNVLTIEADNGTQIIVNRHTPNQELWIAAKSGGYHFALREGEWRSTRDGSSFFAMLNEVLGEAAGEAVEIEPL